MLTMEALWPENEGDGFMLHNLNKTVPQFDT